MDLPFRSSKSLGPQEVEHLRGRVQVYVLVMLGVDLVAHVSDYVMPFLMEGVETAEYPGITLAVRLASTFGLTLALLLARFGRLAHGGLALVESLMTVGLALIYVHIASATMTDDVAGYAAVFAMFGIMLLLSVRAAVIPSPVWRTAGIGVVTMACYYLAGRSMLRGLEPSILDGVNFIALAMVVATSVTSNVIYGLRRKVREALQLGQYTLEEKLGEGGMGAVYRARHAMLRRKAAIKLIRSAGPVTADARQRFEREANATASLQSPHTVQIFDFGVSEEGEFYYVMELLEGIDLETAVARYGPMEPARAVHLLSQACDSLAEAHEAGLVHRDVKPANIVLCRYGLEHDFVKVLDFGLVGLGAAPSAEDAKLTADGTVRGTPAYLAPEVAAGTSAIDGRADLYALGCVLYWLLTGRPPFERETPMATVLAHVNDTVEAPSRVTEMEIPARLDALVLGCLAKDPGERPSSAAELRRRLLESVDAAAWGPAQAAAWWQSHKPVAQPPLDSDADPLRMTLDLKGRRL